MIGGDAIHSVISQAVGSGVLVHRWARSSRQKYSGFPGKLKRLGFETTSWSEDNRTIRLTQIGRRTLFER
jgi:hypothetical protein